MIEETDEAYLSPEQRNLLEQKLGVRHIKQLVFFESNGHLPFNHLYKFDSVLGAGGFGIVLKVINRNSKQTVAIKVSMILICQDGECWKHTRSRVFEAWSWDHEHIDSQKHCEVYKGKSRLPHSFLSFKTSWSLKWSTARREACMTSSKMGNLKSRAARRSWLACWKESSTFTSKTSSIEISSHQTSSYERGKSRFVTLD